MLEYTRRDRNYSCQIHRSGPRSGPDVRKMRRAVGFRSESQKENINPSDGVRLFDVASHLAFQVVSIRADRCKTLHLLEERGTEKALKVTNETETIVHSH